MVTLISQRVVETVHHRMDSLEHNYMKYFERLGCELIPVSNVKVNRNFYFNLPVDRIVLTGGGDINPELYGEKKSDGNYSRERDETEKALLEFAVENEIPVLGICRGMQFINICFGGKLIDVKKHVAVDHKIRILDRDLKKVIGSEISVNSFHGSGFTEKELSDRLNCFAKSSQDDTIEGIYHPSLPIAGIIWHPERESPDEESNEKIVMAFLNKELFWK